MSLVTVAGQGKTVHCPPDKNLLEALQAESVYVDNPCSGMGTCGKCKVVVRGGVLRPPGEHEKRLLSPEELDANVRLACLAVPDGDVEIEVPHAERDHKILSGGYMPAFAFKPAIRKQRIDISKKALDENRPYEEVLSLVSQTAGAGQPDVHVLQSLPTSEGTYTVVLDGDTVIGIETGDTTEALYGLAVDIGTTTVVSALIDMRSGEELAVESLINPQKHQGLDVLSRITYVQELGAEGLATLQSSIVDALSDMAEKLCRNAGIDRHSIYGVSVAANTTMLHLLLGVDPSSIGLAPFAPAFVRSKTVRASEIGMNLAKGATVYCLPSVSAYIGADITAGVHVCGVANAKESVLFIDIGTNGEIALAHNGRLLSCSCAAGPALEGMNISFGMRAAAGAIEDVKIDGGHVELTVIGDDEPTGLCGSGILGAIRELIAIGLVRKDGRMLKEKDLAPDDPRLPLCAAYNGKPAVRLTSKPSELFITQKDVRQVQLAKGAILSGFCALLERAGLEMSDLDRVLVAGQFGAHLPVESLTGCGILPKELSDRIEYLGNASKAGAYMSLMSLPERGKMEALAERIEYLELGNTSGYERLFVKCLEFPSL